MRKILLLLAVAATALITGFVLMNVEFFTDGALLIFFSILLALLANTEYKYDQPTDKKWQYTIYTLIALFGTWLSLPTNTDAQLAIPLLLIYVVTAAYLLTLTVRAWRNKK